MGPAFLTCFGARQPLWSRSCKAPSRPTYPWSSPPSSNWSSISRPPRRSASLCRHRSSPAPTRSSSETAGVHDDFEPALQAMVEQRAGALIVVPGVLFVENIRQLADLTVRARLPTMFYRREFVEVGGLMSYGTN